jgi:hypothetical protein
MWEWERKGDTNMWRMLTRFLLEHRNQLNQQFDEIEINRDLFRQMLTEQINETKKHALIQQK